MNLLESLLDAMVRLEGDALVMHVGEKPYVVTTASPLNAQRGPLSWGQVELSSRVLTPDAVLGMLGQILPLGQRQALEEIGAVEYEIRPPAGMNERFSVVAARGGDDVWLEVRRRPKPEVVQEAEPSATAAAAPPPSAAAMQTSSVAPARVQPVTAPAAASRTPEPVVEPVIDEGEDDEEVFDISLDSVAATVPAAAPPPAIEVVPDISQSIPTDDEVDALLAAMTSAAAASAETTASDEAVEIPLELETLLASVAPAAEDVEPAIAQASEVQGEPVAEVVEWTPTPIPEEPTVVEPASVDEVAIEVPVAIDEVVAIEEPTPVAQAVANVEPAETGEELPLSGPVAIDEPVAVDEPVPIVDAPAFAESIPIAEAAEIFEPPVVVEPAAIGESIAASDVAPAETAVEPPAEEAGVARPPAHEAVATSVSPDAVAIAQSSAIADARAAIEAFVLTPPEPLSADAVAETQAAPAVAADEFAASSMTEVLPFDAQPEPDEIAQPAATVPSPEIDKLTHADGATAIAKAPPAVVAGAPALADTLAAAAALEAAADTHVIPESQRAEAATPVAAAQEPRPAMAAAQVSAVPPAESVQDPVAPVQVPVAAQPAPVEAPSAARGPDVAPAPVMPVREAPAPPAAAIEIPAATTVQSPVFETPAATARVADTAPAAPPPVHEAPAAVTIEEPRPAVVVPISRSPIRPETPAQAPAPSLAPLEHMLRVAAARGASTVYVVAQSKPMIRVDGEISVLESEATFSAADVERVVMDLAPTRGRAAQVGPVEWMSDVPEVGRVRCVTFRDHRGPGVIFRMIPPRAISADQLGLTSEVQALCALPDGLVLVAGARASGKSTLLSAFVDLINRTRSDHVISIESQINFVHESRKSFVSQREVRGDAEAAAAAVRSAFREDPDVLVIEDLRTAEIVSVAIEAAESGRLVLGSLSAPSTVAAIERLVELFSPERRAQVQTALAGALRGVVAQTLLRKMKGGRIAAREVLLNTPAVASLVLENRMFQLPVALEAGRRHGMVPLNDSLVALVRDGTVHVAEAYRKALDREALLALLKRDGIDTSFAERLA